MQGTNNPPYSTNALPLTTVSTTPTSSSTEAASTESPSTTEATTQSVPTTEEPASSTTASTPSSSSITDHTPSSASETTLLTEATEATDGGNLSPTTSVTVSAATVGGGIDAEAGNYGDFIGKKIWHREQVGPCGLPDNTNDPPHHFFCEARVEVHDKCEL